MAAKGRKVSGSEQGKRGELMPPGLTPRTAGAGAASLLHTAPGTALVLLLGLLSANGYRYMIAGAEG